MIVEAHQLWFWRRSIAVGIDFLAASLIFVLTFSAVAGTASDRFRLSGLGVSSSECRETQASQAVLDVGSRTLPGVAWTRTVLCNGTSFGLVRDRTVQLSREDRVNDNVTYTSFANVPVDAAGNPVDPVYLDWLGIAFFLIASVLLVASPMRATPGLRLLGLRLLTPHGERIGLAAAALRLVYVAIAMAIGFVVAFGTFWLVAIKGFSAWLLALVYPGLIAAFVIWWRPFGLRAGLPRAPLHDIWAGTRIVRATPPPPVGVKPDTTQ